MMLALAVRAVIIDVVDDPQDGFQWRPGTRCRGPRVVGLVRRGNRSDDSARRLERRWMTDGVVGGRQGVVRAGIVHAVR